MKKHFIAAVLLILAILAPTGAALADELVKIELQQGDNLAKVLKAKYHTPQNEWKKYVGNVFRDSQGSKPVTPKEVYRLQPGEYWVNASKANLQAGKQFLRRAAQMQKRRLAKKRRLTNSKSAVIPERKNTAKVDSPKPLNLQIPDQTFGPMVEVGGKQARVTINQASSYDLSMVKVPPALSGKTITITGFVANSFVNVTPNGEVNGSNLSFTPTELNGSFKVAYQVDDSSLSFKVNVTAVEPANTGSTFGNILTRVSGWIKKLWDIAATHWFITVMLIVAMVVCPWLIYLYRRNQVTPQRQRINLMNPRYGPGGTARQTVGGSPPPATTS